MKYEQVFFAVSLLASLSIPSESVNIECNYVAGEFSHSLKDTSTYYCNANILIDFRQEAIIKGITGTHQGQKSNDDVDAFYAHTKNISYFPRGLKIYFKNLKAIAMRNCRLREIRQSDLKPFPQLFDLYLDKNDIEIIMEGLFEFNPELVYILLSSNKIIFIHSNTFNNLNRLTHLYLDANTCVSKNAYNSSEMKKIVQQIKSYCGNEEFLSIGENLDIFENSKKFCKIEDLWKIDNNLKSMELRLSSKIEAIASKFESLEDQLTIKFGEVLNQKLKKISKALKVEESN